LQIRSITPEELCLCWARKKERGGIYSRSLGDVHTAMGNQTATPEKKGKLGMNRSEMLRLDSKDYKADMEFFCE
jgi:hypothetical protein